MKRLSTYLLAGIALLSASCSDFLDTAPKDALSPATTWKTETDAESFVGLLQWIIRSIVHSLFRLRFRHRLQ